MKICLLFVPDNVKLIDVLLSKLKYRPAEYLRFQLYTFNTTQLFEFTSYPLFIPSQFGTAQ